MKKKPKRAVNPQEVKTRYAKLIRERTRVIGDMLFLVDTSEEYQALGKRLDDLNAEIESLEAKA